MDAHSNEYLAAAEAVAGDPPRQHGHAVGDLIWFKQADMTYPASGRIVELVPLGAYRVQGESGEVRVVWPEEVVEL
jgi:hypothetical protein